MNKKTVEERGILQAIAVTDLLAVRAAGGEGSGVLFDLRPPQTVAADGLPGARALSLEALQAGEVPDAPRHAPVYLLCERGTLSELAGLYLEAAGFGEVYNVVGGMKAYRALSTVEEGV